MNQELTRKNLKYFRKENGMSQADLAKELSFGRSIISEYESGRKTITDDSAMRFADYFDVEYSDFISCDFEEMELVRIGSDLFYEKMSLFLPIAKSDQALKNKRFKEAVEKHEQIFDQLSKLKSTSYSPLLLLGNMRECTREYAELMKETSCASESAVNYLGLFIFLELLMSNVRKIIESIDYPNVILNQLKEQAPSMKNKLEGVEEEDKKKAKLITEMVSGDEVQKGMTELIKVIKQSPEWKDVGDYYIAIRYAWNSVDNDLSPGMNYRIGSEMLESFAKIGNPYATAILKLI